MLIDPEYNNYYVYSAIYEKGKQTSCGACPVVWEDNKVPQKMVLTWADGNYHLYDGYGLNEEDADFVEDAIYTAMNEAAETFGKIKLEGSEFEVRWCLLEEEQMLVVMDIPDIAGRI